MLLKKAGRQVGPDVGQLVLCIPLTMYFFISITTNHRWNVTSNENTSANFKPFFCRRYKQDFVRNNASSMLVVHKSPCGRKARLQWRSGSIKTGMHDGQKSKMDLVKTPLESRVNVNMQ